MQHIKSQSSVLPVTGRDATSALTGHSMLTGARMRFVHR